MKMLEEIIASKVRPQLNTHHGDIELLEMTPDGFAKVKLTGACSACPGAQQTLSEIVEVALREGCPEVKGVILVQQVSEELISSALQILRKEHGKFNNTGERLSCQNTIR